MGQDDPTSNNKPKYSATTKVIPTTVGLRTLTWIIWWKLHTNLPTSKNVVVNTRPGDRASWEPHGEPGWYIGPTKEHYRCHKTYIHKTIAQRISYTVEFFPKKLNMPNISSTNAAIHVAQYLVHALHNPAPASPLVTLGDAHTEALRTLAEISNNAPPRAIPPRVVPPESQLQHQPTI